MGQLKPGVTYIYERADGVTYAREFGADPSTRFAVGWDYDSNKPGDGRKTYIESRKQDFGKALGKLQKPILLYKRS